MDQALPETLTRSAESFGNDWKEWSEEQRLYLLQTMSQEEMDDLNAHWDLFAHAHQTPPLLAPNGKPWLTWLMIGGRGAGRTRAGAEWIRAQALGLPPFASEAASRIALVGETEHEVREVMIEGVSGLLAVHPPHERPLWLPSRKRLEWRNGAVAQAFPRKIRRACAARSSAARGRMNWPNGAMPKPPSTCCNSACGWEASRGS